MQANFIATKGTISTSTNKFWYADPGQARQTNGESTLGGTKSADACISPLKGAACGDPVSFTEGDMKYSLFGYTTGTAYDLNTLPIKSITHIGFRTRYAISGVTSVKVTLNGDKDLDTIGMADVTSIAISNPDSGSISVSASQLHTQFDPVTDRVFAVTMPLNPHSVVWSCKARCIDWKP